MDHGTEVAFCGIASLEAGTNSLPPDRPAAERRFDDLGVRAFGPDCACEIREGICLRFVFQR